MIADIDSGFSTPPFWVVFTDLDGTLLDPETYSWEEAAPALDLCRRSRSQVIPASSKTRAEMEIIRNQIALSGPFISENGGGIFLPVTCRQGPPPGAQQEGNLWKWPQGIPYKDLVLALKEIGRELGYSLIGFSDMSINEIAELTGLDILTAKLAAMREFDEPFVIRSPGNPDIGALQRAAKQRGLIVTQGGRFFHLHGISNKGHAMERIISLYKRVHGKVVSVAVGDSPNDFPMLERADVSVLVRSGRNFPDLVSRIPGLIVTREKGPKGWNEAVLNILEARSKKECPNSLNLK